MYRSILLVNVGHNPDRPRPGRDWLRNLYRVHQRLAMAFPDARRVEGDPQNLRPFNEGGPTVCATDVHVQRTTGGGFLFRVDPRPGGCPVVLVQSASPPNWEYAFHNASYLLAGCKVLPCHPAFELGQRLAFRLRANVTIKTDGKRRALFGEDKQLGWLDRKAKAHGFRVDRAEVEVGAPLHLSGRKHRRDPDNGKEPMTLFAVDFSGVLEVLDATEFAKALAAGIGPAKAFGCGLLSVAPVAE